MQLPNTHIIKNIYISIIKLLNKKSYYLILLTILLCASIDISSYNYIALGKEEDSDDEDNIRENEKEADDNTDNKDNEVREENKEQEEEEKEEEDEVPFILPFKAVPFP
jgi:hypothetical protein